MIINSGGGQINHYHPRLMSLLNKDAARSDLVQIPAERPNSVSFAMASASSKPLVDYRSDGAKNLLAVNTHFIIGFGK